MDLSVKASGGLVVHSWKLNSCDLLTVEFYGWQLFLNSVLIFLYCFNTLDSQLGRRPRFAVIQLYYVLEGLGRMRLVFIFVVCLNTMHRFA